MEREQEQFDAAGFLELLGDSLRDQLPDHKARTGVLSARIHLRDGEPWADVRPVRRKTRGPHDAPTRAAPPAENRWTCLRKMTAELNVVEGS